LERAFILATTLKGGTFFSKKKMKHEFALEIVE
jgi:hypothetical protein